MKPKIESYLGFAKKSRSLVEGTDTCLINIKKKKVHLIITAEDLSENTNDKITLACRRENIEKITYSSKEKLGAILGSFETGVIGIIDKKFAKVIKEELGNEIKRKG